MGPTLKIKKSWRGVGGRAQRLPPNALIARNALQVLTWLLLLLLLLLWLSSTLVLLLDQRTRGPGDRRTGGPGDQRTRGPGDRRTRGPEDQKKKMPKKKKKIPQKNTSPQANSGLTKPVEPFHTENASVWNTAQSSGAGSSSGAGHLKHLESISLSCLHWEQDKLTQSQLLVMQSAIIHLAITS